MKSVYSGSDKVAEFESYDELRVGANRPAFIYEGGELVYPNPVKDGLVLWYDFSGRTNSDAQRDVADDLSGNGHDGTLQNFNYTAESGYDKNKLLFDGVDDSILSEKRYDNIYTHEATAIISEPGDDYNPISSTLNHRSGESSGFSINRYGKTSTGFRVVIGNGSGLTVVGVTSGDFELIPGYKYHFVATIDDSVNENIPVKIYINGILVKEELIESFVSIQDLRYLGYMVGKYSLSLNSILYNNYIHSTKIYNRPLTPEEITHNYAIEKERFGIE